MTEQLDNDYSWWWIMLRKAFLSIMRIPLVIFQPMWERIAEINIHHKITTKDEQWILPRNSEIGSVFVLKHSSLSIVLRVILWATGILTDFTTDLYITSMLLHIALGYFLCDIQDLFKIFLVDGMLPIEMYIIWYFSANVWDLYTASGVLTDIQVHLQAKASHQEQL